MLSEQFHKVTQGEPPRELAKKIIKYLDNNSLILDCGSGAGNDTIFFASQGHRVIALDKETSILESRLKNLVDINDKIIIRKSDITNFEIEEIDCFYSSLTLSFLCRKDFYVLWNNISNKLKEQTIIGINIFGDKDEWYKDTEDMTFMNKEEFTSLFSNLTVLEFSESEKLGTYMGRDGLPRSKKWHVFECVAQKSK